MTKETLTLSRTGMARRTRPVLFATLAALGMGVVATGHAMGQSESIDADGDGLVTLAEMQVAMPDMTEAEFAALDGNGDGTLDASEISAAQDAGLIAAG